MWSIWDTENSGESGVRIIQKNKNILSSDNYTVEIDLTIKENLSEQVDIFRRNCVKFHGWIKVSLTSTFVTMFSFCVYQGSCLLQKITQNFPFKFITNTTHKCLQTNQTTKKSLEKLKSQGNQGVTVVCNGVQP